MITFDTRLLAALTVLAVVVMILSKVRISDVKVLFWFSFVFMILNTFLIFVFSPEHGVTVYGTRHEICHLVWKVYLVKEQLFYLLNIVLKYTSTGSPDSSSCLTSMIDCANSEVQRRRAARRRAMIFFVIFSSK